MSDLNPRQVPNYDFTVRELINTLISWKDHLKQYWVKIILIALVGFLVGFLYAYLQPVNYAAKSTFVVEDTKSGGAGGLGNLASLAGQFGVDLGGSSGSGVLSGDNILLYFKSIKLAREVLLKPYDSSLKISIADKYAEIYDLKNEWKEDEKINKYVNFLPNGNTDRLQDSLLLEMVKEIHKKRFSVLRVDKKASFIEVNTSMKDEMLSKKYNEFIVEAAINRYINIKTSRQKSTLDKLQARADSISFLINSRTVSGAQLQTTSSTMDINPIYKTNTAVAVETTARDKTILLTLYSEVVKNLELAKFTLSQETPVIQLVDTPLMPLEKIRTRKFYSGAIFSLSISVLFIFGLLFRKIIKEAK
jgi:hypothetical protein